MPGGLKGIRACEDMHKYRSQISQYYWILIILIKNLWDTSFKSTFLKKNLHDRLSKKVFKLHFPDSLYSRDNLIPWHTDVNLGKSHFFQLRPPAILCDMSKQQPIKGNEVKNYFVGRRRRKRMTDPFLVFWDMIWLMKFYCFQNFRAFLVRWIKNSSLYYLFLIGTNVNQAV